MKYVKDALQKDLTAVYENTSLKRVITTMKRHRINAIPVVSKTGVYLGCISEQEVLNEAVPSYMKMMRSTSFMSEINKVLSNLVEHLEKPASEFTNKNYPFLQLNDTLSHAAEIMYREKKVLLPVINKGRLAGMICRMDVIYEAINQ